MTYCLERKIDELMKYEGLYEIISEHFNIIEKIGSGTFSCVYSASLKRDTKRLVALKHVLPTSHPSRTENELQCLKTIGGEKNVVKLLTALRHFDSVIITMDYMPHQHFHEYVFDMDLNEIQLYIRNLLIALEHVHSFNFIHRDIKPSNFLYDRKNKKFCLVDFGLAQKVDPINAGNDIEKISNQIMQDMNASKSHQIIGKENIDEDYKKKYLSNHYKNLKSCNCYGQPSVCKICLCRPPQIASRAGTAGFRAPEVLLKIHDQTTAIDLWSAGVIYMSLLSGTHPIFKPSDDYGSLCQIISLFGSKEVINMAKKYGKLLSCSAHYDFIPLGKVCRFLRQSRKYKKFNQNSDLFVNFNLDNKKLIEKDQTKLKYDSSLLKDNIRNIEMHEKYHKINDVAKNIFSNYCLNNNIVNDIGDYQYNCNETRLISNLSNYVNKDNEGIDNDNKNKNYCSQYDKLIQDNYKENNILFKDSPNQKIVSDNNISANVKKNNTKSIAKNYLIDKIIENKIAYDGVIINKDNFTSEFMSCESLTDELLRNNCLMNDKIIAGNLREFCLDKNNEIKVDISIDTFVNNQNPIIKNNLNKDNSIMNNSINTNEKFFYFAFDLLEGLLDIDPLSRWTATQSLQHPFFAQNF